AGDLGGALRAVGRAPGPSRAVRREQALGAEREQALLRAHTGRAAKEAADPLHPTELDPPPLEEVAVGLDRRAEAVDQRAELHRLVQHSVAVALGELGVVLVVRLQRGEDLSR